MNDDECKHKFVYGGVKYTIEGWTLPGTGARRVHYYDWFYCEYCLEKKYEKLDTNLTDYDPIHFNATPRV